MKNRSRRIICNQHKTEANGFSLVEVSAAMVIFGVTMAFAMPIILQSRISSMKDQAKTGAMIVAQQVFDEIRGRNFASLPTTDQTVIPGGPAITLATATHMATPIQLSTDKASALGRKYKVAIRFCAPIAPATTTECSDGYRNFTITVRDPKGDQTKDSSILYEVNANLTNFL
jgi:prepilin-type N-terminal cleavage/methylation domain-containing protein